MPYTIYHNPKCSKSRQALAILNEHNKAVSVIEYLKTPPSFEDLKHVIHLTGLEASALIRRKGELFENLKNQIEEASSDEIIHLLVNNPSLIERPIVFTKEKAIVCRPVELIEELL